MYINEIPIGTSVRLICDELTFQTEVLNIRNENIHFAMLKPLYEPSDGKLLSFSVKNTILEYDNPEGGVIRFKPEQISNIVFQGVKYLIYVCNTDEKLYNRRKEYRSLFSSPCEVQLGHHKGIKDGYIHDVSRNGINIKILLTDAPVVPIGTHVSISLTYGPLDKIIVVGGTVTRIHSDDLFTSYGILLDNPPMTWYSLVNLNERKDLKLRAETRR